MRKDDDRTKVYVTNQYGPAEEIQLGVQYKLFVPMSEQKTSTESLSSVEYAQLRLLEAINDALQDIASTLTLNRGDRLHEERDAYFNSDKLEKRDGE